MLNMVLLGPLSTRSTSKSCPLDLLGYRILRSIQPQIRGTSLWWCVGWSLEEICRDSFGATQTLAACRHLSHTGHRPWLVEPFSKIENLDIHKENSWKLSASHLNLVVFPRPKLCGQCPRPRMIWAERDVSERRRVSQRWNRSSVKNIGPTSHILHQTHISRRVSLGDPNLAIFNNHFSPSMKSCIMQQPRPQGAEFVFVAPGPQRAGESQSTCGNFRCRPLRCRWLVFWLRKRLPGAVSAGGVSSVLEFWLECMVLIVDWNGKYWENSGFEWSFRP